MQHSLHFQSDSDFPFLNRHEAIATSSRGDLPHWEQETKIQFITFRLADSLPNSIRSDIEARRESFKKYFPEPWDENIRRRYDAIATETEAELLDNGFGACHLSQASVRLAVVDAINTLNGTSCRVIAYVIMPNHVHLLLQPLQNYTISQIVGALKSISAHKINNILNRTGKLWHKEYYDRIIRNQEHFDNVIAYIFNNPKNLPKSAYTLYLDRSYPLV